MEADSGSTDRKDSVEWLAPLDGLRGISILMVLTVHVYAADWPALEGRLGVTVFFVLSGFLITRLLVREERRTSTVNFKAFYIRRAFRLFPIYYLVLGLYAVILLGTDARADLRAGFLSALPWLAFYLQDILFFRGEPMPFYQSWSLGVEEKFYLVWPVIAFRMLSKERARMAAAALAVAGCSIANWVPAGRYVFPYAAISVGCLLALLHENEAARQWLEQRVESWRAWVAVLCLVAIHAAVAFAAAAGSHAIAKTAEILYPIPVSAVLVASLTSRKLGRILSVTPLVLLGKWSYAIYLVHLLVRNGVERLLPYTGALGRSGLFVYLLMLGFSAALAWVLSFAVETPLRELGRRIASGMQRRNELQAEAAAVRQIPGG